MARSRPQLLLALAVGFAVSAPLQAVHAQLTYSPYWFDGFNVSTNTTDINLEIDPNSGLAPPRQGGIDAPVTWVSNVNAYPLDPNDTTDRSYKAQLFGPNPDPNLPSIQPLQLAEDNTNANIGPPDGIIPTIVSPDFDFSGTLPNGDIIGKRITVDIDVASLVPAYDPNSASFGSGYTWAGITVGGESTLIDDVDSEGQLNVQPPADRFGARFVDDRFANFEPFMQAYDPNGVIFDDSGCIGCFLDHANGTNTLSVRIDIDDPNNDGNPWDGVGSTVFTVSVFDPNLGDYDPVRNPNNGDPWFHEIADGGLTSNYISLFGKAQTFSFAGLSNLAVHTFENLTVWSAPAFEVNEDADFNGNGVVDANDFLTLQRNLGLTGQTDNSNGDANFDGIIDGADVAIWNNQYGNAPPLSGNVSAVPEPTTVVLLSMTSLTMLLSRRR